MNSVKSHLFKHPHARAATVRYLVAREEKTRQLMQELLAEQRRRTPKPWWQRVLERLI